MHKQQEYFAYVGSRTTRERNARGDGISVFRVNGAGAWDLLQEVTDLLNPSFLCFDRTRQFLYTIHGDGSSATAFAIDPRRGTLDRLNSCETGGKNPVHIAVDRSNRFLAVPNHLSSSVAVIRREADGRLGGMCDLVTLEGKQGPHRVEQPFPKPHQTIFDPSGKFIVVPDKGVDRTFVFSLDNDGKLHSASSPLVSREGTGPRHASFTPDGSFAYVLGELDSTIVSCRFTTRGELQPFQRTSSTPETFVGDSRAAEIEVTPDGKYLLASNRGHDSVGIFGIDRTTGVIKPIDWISSRGKTPRFITTTPAGEFLVVANEDSDTILTIPLSLPCKPEALPGVVHTGSPVCVIFNPLPGR